MLFLIIAVLTVVNARRLRRDIGNLHSPNRPKVLWFRSDK
jgi:hypothetical protein